MKKKLIKFWSDIPSSDQSGTLKTALLDYIKRCRPGDSEKHNMIALCFSMCREIGENHEAAACIQLKLIESQPWGEWKLQKQEIHASLFRKEDIMGNCSFDCLCCPGNIHQSSTVWKEGPICQAWGILVINSLSGCSGIFQRVEIFGSYHNVVFLWYHAWEEVKTHACFLHFNWMRHSGFYIKYIYKVLGFLCLCKVTSNI